MKNKKNKVSSNPLLIVSTNKALNNVKREVHLIDNSGKILKKWEIDFVPLNAKLSTTGNLYVSGYREEKKRITQGITPLFKILDKRSKTIWEYKNETLHHDFEILPNGNIAFLSYYSELPPKGVNNKTLFEGKIWPDQIIEVSPKNNKIVWRWKTLDHFKIKDLKPFSHRGDLFHTNSIDYIESFYKTGKPALIVSARTISTVFILDKESGKILWKSPPKLFRHQHDASFIGGSRILVFNNNDMISSVKEIDIETNDVLWEYNGGDHMFEKVQFYSSVISGAQRLSNGNTLITLGTRGFILEVTPEKNVVWSMFNSYNKSQNSASWPFESIFKAKRVKVE